jgi:hypothetical protein
MEFLLILFKEGECIKGQIRLLLTLDWLTDFKGHATEIANSNIEIGPVLFIIKKTPNT